MTSSSPISSAKTTWKMMSKCKQGASHLIDQGWLKSFVTWLNLSQHVMAGLKLITNSGGLWTFITWLKSKPTVLQWGLIGCCRTTGSSACLFAYPFLVIANQPSCKYHLQSGDRIGPMVKGWDSWSRDLGSIPSAGGCFWFGCGVPFILTRYLRNGTKNTGGPLCVCTPHMQSKDPPLPLRKE